MNYALIKENEVKNIIVADIEFIKSIESDYDRIISTEELPEGVSIGWVDNGEKFSAPVKVMKLEDIAPISMRQLKLALLKINKLALVPSAIASLDSPIKEEIEIEWQYAVNVDRSGFITTLGTALGLTAEQIDDLFVVARAL